MPRKRVTKCKSDHVIEVDRLSDLPDPMIYHILSFVPTVFAVRTTVLSRRWRWIWQSVPALHFPFMVGFQRGPVFQLFVEQCLIRRRRAMLYVADSSVTSFQLDVCLPVNRPFAADLTDFFQSNSFMNNMKELSLRIRLRPYELPSLNGRCLTRLRLEYRVIISDSCSMNLPSLKSLYLNGITIDSKVLHNLVIGFPSLEKCDLRNILSFDCVQISSPSLKFLEVKTGNNDTKVGKIEAENLQTLVLNNDYCFLYDFSALSSIKDLTLHSLVPTDIHNFEVQIPNLALLENLTLELWNMFRHEVEINISNWNLRHLSLRKVFCDDLKLRASTPNLVSFNYRGNTKFALSMSNYLVNGQFSIWRDSSPSTWFSELITFLTDIINRPWISVGLYVSDDKDLIVPMSLRIPWNPPCPELRHLKVKTVSAWTTKSELRKSLQWLCPSLESLSIETVPEMI